MEERSFYQSVVMHHFYVASHKNLSIIDTDIIRGLKAYYVEWIYATEQHRMYMTSKEMKLIADSMEAFVGADDESTKAWNTLYLKCYHEEKKEAIKVEL